MSQLTIDPLAALIKQSKKKELPLVDHAQIQYEPFKRDFYIESQEVSAMTKLEVDTLRAELGNIKCRGRRPPRPIKKWTQCGLPLQVLTIIQNVLKYSHPTPIQSQAIPAIMSGRDVICIAKTGSGKTVAFLLPLLRHVKNQRPVDGNDGPIAIVLAPTRELAQQTFTEAKRFTQSLNLRVTYAFGGDSIKENIDNLKRGCEILVATPGRLIDLLCANNGRVTNLMRCTFMVLDEADRMFDMGFEQQVMRILANLRPDAQRVLFSATFPRQMESLARKVLQYKPLEIVVGQKSVVCGDIQQNVIIVQEDKKFLTLLQLLGDWCDEEQDQRCLVFVERQESADDLLQMLFNRGYRCVSLHGGKDQADRTSTIQDFKEGVVDIMVATSVASRGLDVKECNLVINYDCPNHGEDYVHRVGRTGRANRKGTAYTLITPQQERFAPDIVRAMAASGAQIPPDLIKMKDNFIKKVERGEAKFMSSGFGGKGLERIEKDVEALRSVQMKSYVLDTDDDDDDDDKEEEAVQEKAKGAAVKGSDQLPDQKDGDTDMVGSESKETFDKMPDVKVISPIQRQFQLAGLNIDGLVETNIAAAQARAAEKARQIATRILGNIVTDPSAEGYRKLAAQKFSSMLNSKTSSSAMSSSLTRGENLLEIVNAQLMMRANPNSVAIVEINDYAELVREKIVSREVSNMLQEMYKVSVQQRGKWIPLGRSVSGPNEKKLHLVVEGQTKASVEMAVQEIKSILSEATAEVLAYDPRIRRR
ncbi:hypothetical protein MP228_000373 [Amoeboaphelidium protococcarum]|nr:hypothetical protein MP228_000373 [Amoeboaphelidium protococcarum]